MTPPPVSFHLDQSSTLAAHRAVELRARLANTTASDVEQRALLTAALAVALDATSPRDGAQNLDEAEELADRAGTPLAHAFLRMAHFAVDMSPDSLPRRVVLAREAWQLLVGQECRGACPQLRDNAYFMLLGTLMEQGDIAALDEALSPEAHPNDEFTPLLDTRHAVWFRCARACMDGRIDAAEAYAHQGRQLALAAEDVDAEAVWIGQLAIIRWMQGRISEMEAILLRMRQADPVEPIWGAAVAWIWTHQGRISAARGMVESLPQPHRLRRGRNWLATLAILAEVVADIGSDDLVAELHGLLLPFVDRIVPIGLGVMSWGTVARPLALLARRRGHPEETRRRYQQAIRLAGQVGAQPWLIQAQIEYSELLAADGDRDEARRTAAEALTAARQLELRLLENQADQLMAGPAGGEASGGTRTEKDRPRIRVLGDFRVTPTTGRDTVWKSRKARTLLKILIARRGAALARESAMGLLWPGEPVDQLGNRLAVALTTIRTALDPEHHFRRDAFIVTSRDVIRLRIEELSIDVEEFLAAAATARHALAEGSAHAESLLRVAVGMYTGDVFAETLYAAWAENLRRQAHLALFDVSHALADIARDQDDHLQRVDLYRDILHLDPYDQRAHDGLIDALGRLRATRYVAAARRERDRRLAELGMGEASRL